MVKLEKKPIRGILPENFKQYQLGLCLPFYKSRSGERVHRVRSGQALFTDGVYTHTSLSLWCGATGSIGNEGSRGYLSAEAPDNAVFCATCEGRAIGAGMDGTRYINGRFCLFSPRI